MQNGNQLVRLGGLALLLGVGCGASERHEGAGATGGAGGMGATGAEQAPDLRECPVSQPCDVVEESYGEFTEPPNDARIRCVIQAFHDRTPGVYVHSITSWGLDGPHGPGLWVYLVKPDGSVKAVSGVGSVFHDPSVCTLQQPSDYEPCLASTPTDGYATPECDVLTWAYCVPGAVSCD
jgi:hypothetical protein